MAITRCSISLCLCRVPRLNVEQNTATKAWDTVLKKPVHGALSALKAHLIDKTHDWVTDYTGCFTFGACLVSQEDVETNLLLVLFPLRIMGLLY